MIAISSHSSFCKKRRFFAPRHTSLEKSALSPHYYCLNPSPAPDPEFLLAAIEVFLATCRRPATLEYGENPIPLALGSYALEIRSGRLSIERARPRAPDSIHLRSCDASL
jgi:hypothetical protein